MRKTKFLILILTTTILVTSESWGQEVEKKFKFRKIESKVKISDENVNKITQDSQGFIWVGTENGLNRFDGYNFKIYRNIPGDSTSLLKNNIQSILEDSHGTLWISTLNSGLHCYNRELDNFIRLAKYSEANCQIMNIIEDSDHNIWIGGIHNYNAFMARYSYLTKEWKTLLLFPTVDPIFTIQQQSKDEFWLGTRQNGLFRWNQKTNHLEQFKHDPLNQNSIPGDLIQKILKDPKGFLWIDTRSGLSRFDPIAMTYKNYTVESTTQIGKQGLPVNVILDICMDGEYLWLATENGGLSRMHMADETFTNFKYDKNDPNSIINNSIWSLYKDDQGRIWIGSYAKGLCVFDKLLSNFSEIDIPLDNNLVNAILRDSKGRFWMGTEEGVFMLDKNILIHFKHDPNNPTSISTNAVTCLYEDSKKQIWTCQWAGGINRYNEKTKSFIRYPSGGPKQETKLFNQNVLCITESTQTKELLICTFGGLFILKDQEKGIFENITNGRHTFDQLLNTAYEDRKKNIWIGSYSGLSLFNIKAKTYTEIMLSNNNSEIEDRVNSILEDHKGRLWIASHDGLYQKISLTKSIHYTTKEGLPTNVILGILEDTRGILWLGTTKGLVEFNPETKTFKTYDESDGLLSSEFRRKAFFKDADGKLFVGGQGLNTFYPERLTHNETIPLVYLTDLIIFNEPVKPGPENEILQKSITVTKEITLTYKESFFSIHYVGLNYTSSNKNQYAYKLDGFDKDWNYVGDLRFATYTNLNPGTYTFHVKASNNDNVWNEKGVVLIIHILPPWWSTIWFRVLIVFIIILLIISIFYIRLKSIRQQNISLEETVNQRTLQLQDTNHQLGIREQEINKQNHELIQQREELASQNEELVQGQEETSAQRDLLALQNKELEEARNIIEQKNKETLLHNETLEIEVVKRTQELLAHNNQLEQFAFISAHNLRAPVARILGLGEILRLPAHSLEDEKNIITKLIYTTQELDRVVKDLNQILDIRKNSDSVISVINLTEEIELVKGNLQKEIDDTDAEIQVDFIAVEEIRSVKPYIDSILMNLISNAIKYRHPNRKPLIKLRTEKIEGYFNLYVSDNGLGIDLAQHSEKLFKLYNRFHFHIEGKGLGLYMTKTQVIALGGSIEATSEIDQGITFKITLPFKVKNDRVGINN